MSKTKAVIPLSIFDNNGDLLWTLPGMSKPVKEYAEAVRKAIGFMNMHRDPKNYHDDGSPEYYIRADLCRVAEALENLTIEEVCEEDTLDCGCSNDEFGCQGYHGT